MTLFVVGAIVAVSLFITAGIVALRVGGSGDAITAITVLVAALSPTVVSLLAILAQINTHQTMKEVQYKLENGLIPEKVNQALDQRQSQAAEPTP